MGLSTEPQSGVKIFVEPEHPPHTVVVDYSNLWFKQTDDLEWYCLLCKAYTTEGHVKSERHVKGAEAILGWAAGDGNGVFFVFFCFLFVLFLFTALTK